ncbi:hypothetical protein I79_020357 [Cricetulus griseus]|uniref:Uncharacterized protein n=1 Tax=Cricetulus griseus TaxID=10029 RepID=G3I9U7_CRIGR|nr:hypothetical protein I79_020357 [Cricetulus griseus]
MFSLRLPVGHRPFLERAPPAARSEPGPPVAAALITRALPGTCRDWIAEVTALPRIEPPGTFVPVDTSLSFSGIRWDPGPGRLRFL